MDRLKTTEVYTLNGKVIWYENYNLNQAVTKKKSDPEVRTWKLVLGVYLTEGPRRNGKRAPYSKGTGDLLLTQERLHLSFLTCPPCLCPSDLPCSKTSTTKPQPIPGELSTPGWLVFCRHPPMPLVSLCFDVALLFRGCPSLKKEVLHL